MTALLELPTRHQATSRRGPEVSPWQRPTGRLAYPEGQP